MQPPDQQATEAEAVYQDYREYEPPPPLQEPTEAEPVYRNYRDYEPPPPSLSPEQRLIIGGAGVLILFLLPWVWPESLDKFLNAVPTPVIMLLFLFSLASCLAFPVILVWSVVHAARGFTHYRYFPMTIWLWPVLLVMGFALSPDAYGRLLMCMLASALLCLVESVIRDAPRPVVLVSCLPLVCTGIFSLFMFGVYAGQGV